MQAAREEDPNEPGDGRVAAGGGGLHPAEPSSNAPRPLEMSAQEAVAPSSLPGKLGGPRGESEGAAVEARPGAALTPLSSRFASRGAARRATAREPRGAGGAQGDSPALGLGSRGGLLPPGTEWGWWW